MELNYLILRYVDILIGIFELGNILGVMHLYYYASIMSLNYLCCYWKFLAFVRRV
jgi:hypothetical protein